MTKTPLPEHSRAYEILYKGHVKAICLHIDRAKQLAQGYANKFSVPVHRIKIRPIS